MTLLAERGVDVVTLEGWRAIDAAERALGSSRGRERTTIHERAELDERLARLTTPPIARLTPNEARICRRRPNPAAMLTR